MSDLEIQAYSLSPRIDIVDVLEMTARRFGLTMAELRGTSRKYRISHPRQLAYLLAREWTKCSFPMIGRALGNRDHSSILHGCRVARQRLDTSEVWLGFYTDISESLTRLSKREDLPALRQDRRAALLAQHSIALGLEHLARRVRKARERLEIERAYRRPRSDEGVPRLPLRPFMRKSLVAAPPAPATHFSVHGSTMELDQSAS